MSLRNKIAILSITLMSLMTIPTLAENDNQPVTSRIENANFDVQIKTPEGWSETKDFTSVPETFTFGGTVYRGLQFRNGSELHGCVVYFADDSSDNDDDEDSDATLIKVLGEAQEFAFPGSTLSKFTISKVTLDGSFAADIETEAAKVNVKGTVEGSVANETGDPTKLTITGTIHADSTKGNFAVGTGTFAAEGSVPLSGTTGVHLGDDYEVIIAIWGTEEDAQVRDTYRFLEALSVTKKAPVETAGEVVALSNDTAAASEPVTEVVVTLSVTVTEVAADEVVVTESVAATEVAADTAVVTESVAAVEAVEAAPVTTEASA